MSYLSWSRANFQRPPFFKSLLRDIKSTASRLYKGWMARFEITV